MSDEDLFAQAMGAVTPLKQKGKVQAKSSTRKQQLFRRMQAPPSAQHKPAQHKPDLQRTDKYTLKASSVPAKDVNKLANMRITAALDLHGLTQAEAEQAMQRFFRQAIANGNRYICVIHGQGRHSRDGNPILKRFTYQWLEHGCFSSHILIATPSRQSGGGATHILLRKAR